MKLTIASVFLVVTVDSCSSVGQLRAVPSLEDCKAFTTCYEVTSDGQLIYHIRER